MNPIKMNVFGKTLTDRADGKKAFAEIISKHPTPYILDFGGVISLGSSFGDEVVLKLAIMQGNKITIKNANDGIRSCLKRVIESTNVQIQYDRL